MESNGERHKIHVSQSTADLLVAAGKVHWLTPRDEQVLAKGKGLMQTYFCEPKTGGASRGTAESSLSGGRCGSGTESVGHDDASFGNEGESVDASVPLSPDDNNIDTATADVQKETSNRLDAEVNANAEQNTKSIDI